MVLTLVQTIKRKVLHGVRLSLNLGAGAGPLPGTQDRDREIYSNMVHLSSLTHEIEATEL